MMMVLPSNGRTALMVTVILTAVIGQSVAGVALFSPVCTDTGASVVESPQFRVTFCRMTKDQCAELCAGRDYASYIMYKTSCSCSNNSTNIHPDAFLGSTDSVMPSQGCEEVYVTRKLFVQSLYRTVHGPLICDVEGIGICRGNVIHGSAGHLHPDMIANDSQMLNQLSPFVADTEKIFYEATSPITILFNHSVLVRYLDVWRQHEKSYVESVQIQYTYNNPTVQYYTVSNIFSYSSTPYDTEAPETVNVTYDNSNYARIPVRKFVAQAVTITVFAVGSPMVKLELIGCRYDEALEETREPHSSHGCYLFSSAQVTAESSVSGDTKQETYVLGEHVYTDAIEIHEEYFIAPKIKSLPLGRPASESSCSSILTNTCLSHEQLILSTGESISCTPDAVLATMESNYSIVRENSGHFTNSSACETAALSSFKEMKRAIEITHHSKCPNKTRELYRQLVAYHAESFELCVSAVCRGTLTAAVETAATSATEMAASSAATTTTTLFNTTETSTLETNATECEVPTLTEPPEEETSQCFPGPPTAVYGLYLRRPWLDEPLCDSESNIARIHELYPATVNYVSEIYPTQSRAVGQQTSVQCSCPYITALNDSNAEPLVCKPDFTYHSETFHGCVGESYGTMTPESCMSVPSEAPEGGTREWDNSEIVDSEMTFSCPADHFFQDWSYPHTLSSVCACRDRRWKYEAKDRLLPPCILMCSAMNTSAVPLLVPVVTTQPTSKYGLPPTTHFLPGTVMNFSCAREPSSSITTLCLANATWSVDITDDSLCNVTTTTATTITTKMTTTTPDTTAVPSTTTPPVTSTPLTVTAAAITTETETTAKSTQTATTTASAATASTTASATTTSKGSATVSLEPRTMETTTRLYYEVPNGTNSNRKPDVSFVCRCMYSI
ncbi:hypothetical protein FHG87_009236 [Trinorchestia longiramus]|nr:hypothetical protein FHG87_009236 [Trinorchestia longiramus]